MKYLILLFTVLMHGCFCTGVFAQTLIKGPALIEGIENTTTSAGTKTLTVASQTRQIFTGTQNHILRMAVATTLPIGRYVYIANRSTGVITIHNTSNVTIGTVAPGDQKIAILKDNTTANGTWDISENQTVNALLLQLQRATSTGVLDGLSLTVNGGNNARFDIAPGLYDIADLTDINAPVITQVNYPGSTSNVVTNLGTQEVTFILLDAAGNIVQQATFPTPTQRRQYAFIGRLNHSNFTNISFADTFPDYKISPVASFYDLVDALAPFKMDEGNMISPNGANLSFNRSAGKVFFRADNYTTDKTNPHTKSFAQQTLQPFRKMTRTITTDISDVTVMDPVNYDSAGTVTAIGGASGRSTIQRVYLFKSGAVRVAYGQTIYASFAEATAAVGKESFIVNPTIDQTAVLIALVVLNRTCTSLQDTTCALIVPASRFGGTGGGGGGGGGSPELQVSGTQSLAAAATITLLDTPRQRVKIQASGAGTVTVLLPNGTRAAQEVHVLGMSDTNVPVIADTGNVSSNGSISFTNGVQKLYIWDETNTIWKLNGGY